jgi:hypothetical protein
MLDAMAAAPNKFTLYAHCQTLYAQGNDLPIYLTSLHATIKAVNSIPKLQFIVGNRRGKFHGNYIPNLKVGYI